MKTFFVNPPTRDGEKYIREGRCMQSVDSWATIWPPLTLAIMATIANKYGDVGMLDCNVEDLSPEATLQQIVAFRPDEVVGNASFPSFDSDAQFAKMVKEACGGAVTLGFGVFFTLLEETSLRAAEGFDVAIVGEPEQTFDEFLDSYQKTGTIKPLSGLFSIQKELFDLLPELTIGVGVVTGVDNTHPSEDIDALLSQTIEEMKKNFATEKAQEHPRIKPWRNAFSKVGISGSKFPSSIESMTRRILKGDPFPKINPLVDLYNSLSLKYLVPMGGHDLDTLDGNLYLQFAEGWEPFTPMGGGETATVPKGELVYRDDREVLTRNWVWRQSEKDKAI